jgi:peroxiredoxin
MTQSVDSESALALGRMVNEFSLTDVRGQEVSLTSMLDVGRVLLISYRGGWCPLCNMQLGKLSQAYEEFERRKVQIVAISTELPEQGQEVLRKIGPPYRLLVDVERVVLESLGLVVETRDLWSKVNRKHDFAHPGAVLIGQDHRIQWAYRGRTYRDRPSIKVLLEAIDKSA